MHKQKLNELCQKKRWATPAYGKRSVGPTHKPMFEASVTVNGQTFDGPEDKLFATLKEAQNEAALLALSFFLDSERESLETQPQNSAQLVNDPEQDASKMAIPLSSSDENPEVKEKSYKKHLHEMAQKKGIGGPTYQTVFNGIPHLPTFVSTVEIGGESFEGDVMKTKKQAENSAAKVAWMKLKEESRETMETQLQNNSTEKNMEIPLFLPMVNNAKQDAVRMATPLFFSHENPEVEEKSYKKRLHEMAQKREIAGPTYKTVFNGIPHLPAFVSIVEIGSESFEGDVMKTKKQAENSAAKAAWMKLKEETTKSVEIQLQNNAEEKSMKTPQLLHFLNDAGKDADWLAMPFFSSNMNPEVDQKSYKNHLNEMVQKRGIVGPTYQTVSNGLPHLPTFVSTVEIGGKSFQGDVMKTKRQAENSAAKVAWMKLREENPTRIPSELISRFQTITIEDVPSLGKVSTSMQSSSSVSLSNEQTEEISSGLVEKMRDLALEMEEKKPNPQRSRILVFPRKGSPQVPQGAKLLPFTDDQWVAVVMN